MPDDSSMINRNVLRDQYGDDARLTARQSLWRLRTGPPLPETVLDLAALGGAETIVDVGCGNGAYLAELRRRGHTGRVLGLDLSEGMARHSYAYAPTGVADVQTLPLRDGGVDVVLSLHMLYHVPDLHRAVAELRRVLRPGGTAMVATNGLEHTVEAKRVIAAAAHRVTGIDADLNWDSRRFHPEAAREVLATAFDDIEPHWSGETLPVREPAVITGYLASWPPESIGVHAGPVWDDVQAEAGRLIAAHFAAHREFHITSQVGIFRCR